MGSIITTQNDEVKGYRFTESQDWFSGNISRWTSLIPLVTTQDPRILEIGTWEGRSATFLLTSPLCANGGSIVCIDHFDLFATTAGQERHEKVLHNLTLTGRPFRVIEKYSVTGLMILFEEATEGKTAGFDWVYIDGSHMAGDTFLEAELAWRMANEGAIFIFNNYRWEGQPRDGLQHPTLGTDAFVKLHENEFDVIFSDFQKVLRKKSNMHIGSLVEDSTAVSIKVDSSGYRVNTAPVEGSTAVNIKADSSVYDVNIALVVDASYAMPATVTLDSITKHSSRSIAFYIVDCGLGDEDKHRMMSSMRAKPNVSLVFIPINGDGLGASLGPVWAKVDLIDLVPVERALYIDADILARGDVGTLWDTDLGGKLLGACVDVGFPFGHEEIERGPYFNAGVLLMDLKKLRNEVPKLRDLAESMRSSKFKEQDVMNTHFRGAWKSLSLQWNAQGLGTYAEIRTADRDAANLHEMANPILVHFTGPISPSLPLVLDPDKQPCFSKPWGYLKARGHPFAEEWWAALKETPWKEWVESEEYRSWHESEKEKVKACGLKEFDQVVGRGGS